MRHTFITVTVKKIVKIGVQCTCTEVIAKLKSRYQFSEHSV